MTYGAIVEKLFDFEQSLLAMSSKCFASSNISQKNLNSQPPLIKTIPIQTCQNEILLSHT